MIFTYRFGYNPSNIKRTYKDVTSVEFSKAGIAVLFGTIPAVYDAEAKPWVVIRYAQNYTIAAINLAPGEYLEREDLPRD